MTRISTWVLLLANRGDTVVCWALAGAPTGLRHPHHGHRACRLSGLRPLPPASTVLCAPPRRARQCHAVPGAPPGAWHSTEDGGGLGRQTGRAVARRGRGRGAQKSPAKQGGGEGRPVAGFGERLRPAAASDPGQTPVLPCRVPRGRHLLHVPEREENRVLHALKWGALYITPPNILSLHSKS